MNDAFPIDVSPGFISITNPFDGVEVGTVANIPPEGAQMLIQTAKDGARVCRNLPRHERARLHAACASLASFSLNRTPPWRCITLPMATCSRRGVWWQKAPAPNCAARMRFRMLTSAPSSDTCF